MKIFLDTNVLIAACLEGHPDHEDALPILNSIHSGRIKGFTSAHAVLEVYSTLTRSPGVIRSTPQQAAAIIENVLLDVTAVALSQKEYAELIARLGRTGVVGGQAYDALHLECARKCEADKIYTFNTRHFQSLAANDLRDRIVAP